MAKKSKSNDNQLRYQSESNKLHRFAPNARCLFTTNNEGGSAKVGEVRAKVKLTNAVDEGLVRRGLLPADKVRSYEADALVDTGAVRSVLPRFVVEQLGLAIVGKARATYANDLSDFVDITEVVGIVINTRRTTEEMLVLGSEVLIGQTVLESLDLFVDCLRRQVVGNPAHPDQPIIKIKGVLESALESKAERVVQHNL